MSKTIRFKAIILAGGSGERFWPLSTTEKPKQFLRVFGDDSLIRQTFTRLRGLAAVEDIHVVTSAALVRTTRKELPELPARNIVGEPMRRDTGAAVALGVGLSGEDCVLGFFPADQLVQDARGFRKAVKAAIRLASQQDRIVTLGIRPTYPATGFGYVNPESGRFVEKPDVAKAKAYLRKGYLWNAGMFIARTDVFRQAFAEHAPELATLAAPRKLGRAALVAAYERLPRISFDYAVMEKQQGVGVVPCDVGWDDVGSYAAFEKYFKKDVVGNIALGEVNAVESDGCIAVANGAKIALLGVQDMVVVTTKDAVLVVAKDKVAELKKLFRAK